MKRLKLKKLAMTALLVVAGLQPLHAQENLQVSGLVTDAKTGEPMIGVTVKPKGKSGGTVTDFDGNFKLSVSKEDVLEFSYIGYVTAERKATEHLDVKLDEDLKSLEEVIVVGYGVQKKSDLTGAVTQVKAADIQNRAITNVNEAFAGKAAGVQSYASSGKPGSTPNLQVRGIGSNGSSAPLFVVDGRVSSTAGNIDPNDIESIEVLKDGASAAIYGAAAGNGVILITTKKGKGNGTVSYDLQIASQSLSNKPHVMNSEQFIDFYNELGMLNMEGIYQNWDFKQNTDWCDATFGPSLFMKHSVSLQGGGEKGSYYLSGSYLDNNGMIKGDRDTQRNYTGLVNANYKIKPWLEAGTNLTVDYSKVKYIADGGQFVNIIGSAVQCNPLMAPTYTLADMPPMMKESLLNFAPLYGPMLQDGNGNYYGVAPYIASNIINPLILRDRADNQLRTLAVSGTAYLNLTPIKDFLFTSRLSFSFSSAESYSANIPYFADYGSSAFQNYIDVSAGSNNSNYWQWENFANYHHSIGDHNLSYMLGASFSETRTFGVTGDVRGLEDGSDLGFSRNDPNFMYFAYATPSAIKTVAGGEPLYTRKLAYFGRINYDYKGRYLAQFSLRADAADSSILPVDNRWGYFPAGSLGWVISQEKFMQGTNDWLSHLKLRASWGMNGSLASLGNWMYAATVARYGSYNFGNELNYSYSYAPTAMGNKDLKWETSEQINIGIDARFLNNRLSLNADYYRKETKDLIVSGATLSNIAGYPSSPINAGSITNRGFEFELGWQDNIGDFSYGVRANLTTLKNKVTKVYDTVDAINGSAIISDTKICVLTKFEKDQPAWYFYGLKYEGVNRENGEPIYWDKNGDGMIGDEDRTYIGKGIPDITYGITVNAAWKGVDLMVFGSGVSGVDIYNMYDTTFQYANNRLTYFTSDRWTPENTNGSMPKANINHTNFLYSSASVFSGAYFKIKQIQLGYTLPQALLNKISFQKARLYCSLENFFTFSDYIGFDPEVTGAGNAMGVDFGMYPSSKKVVFGLNITF